MHRRALPLLALATISCAAVQRQPIRTDTEPVGFRLLQWNVSDSAWMKHPEATRAVLRHSNADIFVLVQVAPAVTADDVRRMLSGIRGAWDTTWSVSLRDEMTEHTVIASRWPMREVADFYHVRYPESGDAILRASPPDTNSASNKRDAIPYVHTNGAVISFARRRLLVAGVHFTCCATPGDWRQRRQLLGAIIARDHIRAAVAGERPEAVVVAGDMNLVAGSAPIDTVLTTLAGNALGPMRRAEALRPDGLTDWTWDGRGTAFPQGRLDNVTYSAGSLVVRRAVVWDTETMKPDTLAAHHLVPGMSQSINRHRPVVVDFSFR